MVLVQMLGSLAFAIVLIGTLGLVLIVSTTLESFYGTPFVQRFFYQSGWFDIFLGLLAVNILCSALLRFPYKKKHTGFVMTHVGILLLLIGSLFTRIQGVGGQMMIYEGQKKDALVQNTYEFVVHQANGNFISRDLAQGREIKQHLNLPNNSLEITIRQFLNNALVKNNVINSPSAPLNHAAKLTLFSKQAETNDTLWLVEKNPLDPNSGRFSMGPAVFQILEKPKPKLTGQNSPEPANPPTLLLHSKASDLHFSLDLNKIPSGETPVGSGELFISNIKYYPDARVNQDNTLSSISENPKNPAIEFDITGPDRQSEHYVKFALFPEFESMHEKKSKKHFDLTVDLLTPSAGSGFLMTHGPSLSIYFSKNGAWSYLSKSSKTESEGVLKIGETYQTGWMDFSFRVESLLEHADFSKEVQPDPDSGKGGQPAVQVSVVQNGKTLFKDWLLEDAPQSLPVGKENLILLLRGKTHQTPFTLELKNFRKTDYPGTHQPSSFESDVTLYDPKENLTLSKTISMNHPLDYKGYRIFQSSYVQDPLAGEASVFTVAKNPGISLIYGGAIVIFLGAFLVFFVPPYSSMLKEVKK